MKKLKFLKRTEQLNIFVAYYELVSYWLDHLYCPIEILTDEQKTELRKHMDNRRAEIVEIYDLTAKEDIQYFSAVVNLWEFRNI